MTSLIQLGMVDMRFIVKIGMCSPQLETRNLLQAVKEYNRCMDIGYNSERNEYVHLYYEGPFSKFINKFLKDLGFSTRSQNNYLK